MNQEALDHNIEDDLTKRNQNWDEIDDHIAADVNSGNPHGIDAKANKIIENWINVSPQSPWTTYSNRTPGYRKNDMGIVFLRGEITSGSLGATIFTLPSGYRPARRIWFAINANNEFGIIQIEPTGIVMQSIGTPNVVGIGNISFIAEQ